MDALKIGVVEDDESFRADLLAALKRDPAVAAVSEWRSAEEFWRDGKGAGLDLVYVDCRLPGMSGVELIRKVVTAHPERRMIMLTTVSSDETIFEALEAGALGYILKAELGEIQEMTRIVMEGGAAISPSIAFRVLRNFRRKPAPEEEHRLTNREIQILELLSQGYRPRKVAEMIGITENTIRNHVRNIYRKLNVTSQLEMMRKASDLGLV